jgi:hypothetical protein
VGLGEDVFHAMRLLAYGLFVHAPLLLTAVGAARRASSKWWFG